MVAEERMARFDVLAFNGANMSEERSGFPWILVTVLLCVLLIGAFFSLFIRSRDRRRRCRARKFAARSVTRLLFTVKPGRRSFQQVLLEMRGCQKRCASWIQVSAGSLKLTRIS